MSGGGKATLDARGDTPYPGVLRLRFGEIDSPSLLDYSGASPAVKGLEELGPGALPFKPEDITGYRSAGRVVISVPLLPDEELFGFGLQFQLPYVETVHVLSGWSPDYNISMPFLRTGVGVTF